MNYAKRLHRERPRDDEGNAKTCNETETRHRKTRTPTKSKK
jgi:hypothetical protein